MKLTGLEAVLAGCLVLEMTCVEIRSFRREMKEDPVNRKPCFICCVPKVASRERCSRFGEI